MSQILTSNRTGLTEDHVWVSWHCYPKSINGADRCIDLLLEESVVSWRAAASWHFLRYVDENGFHVRFRMLVPLEVADRSVEIFEKLKAKLVVVSMRGWKPLRGQEVFPHLVIPIREASDIKWELYKPELRKWGSGDSLEQAHHLFLQSSQLAAKVIEREPSPSERALYGLFLLHFIQTLLPISETQSDAFLRTHANWWSDDPLGRTEGMKNSDTAAAVRLDRWIERQQGSEELLISTELLASSIVEVALSTAENRSPIYFVHQHLHLALNRFGIHGSDEAWLAQRACDPMVRQKLMYRAQSRKGNDDG